MNSGFLKRIACFVLLGAALAGCNSLDRLENIGATPGLAPITDPTKDPNYKPVTMPDPGAPGPHAQNSLWMQGSHAFFHDPRASRPGDIITVDVTIADNAQESDATTRTRANTDAANMTNFFGLENTLTKDGADPASLVNAGSSLSNAGTGQINRAETINLTLAAIVTQLLSNGNLVITGHQQVLVNNEMRDLEVSGIVRTEDITSDNTVNLAQVAEARIAYGGKGQITDVQQPRYGDQLFDILMPVVGRRLTRTEFRAKWGRRGLGHRPDRKIRPWVFWGGEIPCQQGNLQGILRRREFRQRREFPACTAHGTRNRDRLAHATKNPATPGELRARRHILPKILCHLIRPGNFKVRPVAAKREQMDRFRQVLSSVRKSPRNSEPGATPVTESRSRARVQAT